MTNNPNQWTEQRLRNFIDNKVEENLRLEYKSGRALDMSKKDKQARELLIEVSAMANSAGGVVIVGLAEDHSKGNKQLSVPTNIEPVDCTKATKDWIENVLENAKPSIDGLEVHTIRLSSGPNDVAYVVEVPQSTTAHQASDKRYYRRRGTHALPMDHDEIENVRCRGKVPKVDIDLVEKRRGDGLLGSIEVYAKNTGVVVAKHVVVKVEMPTSSLFKPRHATEGPLRQPPGTTRGEVEYTQCICDNITRRQRPILPTLDERLAIILLDPRKCPLDSFELSWEVYVDAAPQPDGSKLVQMKAPQSTP